MTKLLVIGCASIDVLHIRINDQEQTHHTIGGAGLYTALAAWRKGADVTLYSPRPDKLTGQFLRAAETINWVGPTVPLEEMPRLEIAHHGGGRATLLEANWGAESLLTETAIPVNIRDFSAIHIAALSSAKRQLEFNEHCREHGARKISAGTYAKLVYGETENVRELLNSADVFFLNENEAIGLFSSLKEARTTKDKLLFVTKGEQGVDVYKGREREWIAGCTAIEVDPTGAGDTFCGATLAGLISGRTASDAARAAVSLAATCIQSIGPSALL